jgi:transposase
MTHRTTVIADHHKSVFVCQILDHQTGESRRATLGSNHQALRPFLEGLPRPAQVFIEACRSWEWVADLCEDLSIDFGLVDPRQMPEISKSLKKTDRADVEAMVKRFLVTGLPQARAASRSQRELRLLTRELCTLRSQHRVHLQRIHALVDAHGCPGNMKLFASPEWRERMKSQLPPDAWFTLELQLERWDLNEQQRRQLEERVRARSSNNEDIQLLQSIPGIGPIIGATIFAEILDIKDFSSARQFAAFTGLVPRVRSSAGKARIGKITKSGPASLRWALTQAVMCSHGSKKPTDHYLVYKRKRAKRKAYKDALCIGAHKLARVIWAMLTRRTEYKAVSSIAS